MATPTGVPRRQAVHSVLRSWCMQVCLLSALWRSQDERSRSWFLMSGPVTPFATMATYVCVVCYGPRMMQGRAAWSLKPFLVLYNLALVALSAYMCSEFLLSARAENYSLLCQPVDFSSRPNAIRMLNVCWLYYASKYIELIDTLCFVLRKKNRQITFLHVYHHATMIPFWWMTAAYIPGGQTFFHPLLNTGVHVVMYTYYGLAALGPDMQPYLWWKKYLTSLQLIQFLLITLHTGYNILFEPDCTFPKSWELLALAYALILIALFSNFYRKAYTSTSTSTTTTSTTTTTAATTVATTTHPEPDSEGEGQAVGRMESKEGFKSFSNCLRQREGVSNNSVH